MLADRLVDYDQTLPLERDTYSRGNRPSRSLHDESKFVPAMLASYYIDIGSGSGMAGMAKAILTPK